MKKIQLILSLILISHYSFAAPQNNLDNSKFKKSNETTPIIVKCDQTIVLNDLKGSILLIKLKSVKETNTPNELIEAAKIDCVIIKKSVFQVRKNLIIAYKKEQNEKGNFLTKKYGSMSFFLVEQKIDWSLQDESSIFIYVPEGFKYAILEKINSEENKKKAKGAEKEKAK